MAGYTTPSWTNGTTPAIDASKLTAMGQAIELAQHPYGVCTTAAATAAKTAMIDYSNILTLYTGLTIRIKFTNGNTAANPTLSIGTTASKPIMAYGTTPLTSWEAGQILTFTYDGTNWVQAAPSLKVVHGSYTGAGNYGSGNKSSLTFPFVPCVVFITGMLTPCILSNTGGDFYTGTFASAYNNIVTLSGNQIQWYSNGGNSGTQLDQSGTTYYYTAIGY